MKRVLVVDDYQVNRRVAEILLGKFGYAVTCATNGNEALVCLCNLQESFDLVIMDCQMPVMDGLDATRRLRAWEKENARPRVPVIALTAGGGGVNETSCLNAGMDAFLLKPLDSQKLVFIINQLLG